MADPVEVMLTRRSVGRVAGDPPPRAAVEELLTAAIHAPNHHLTEPWRFVVLTGEARRGIGRAHAEAIRRQRPDIDSDALAREADRLLRAPVVIACIVVTDPGDAVRAREDRDAVAAAVQNLLLAAHARGYGAMWRTGAMVDEPEVRAALGAGPDAAIVGFVYLGAPAADVPPRPRSGLDAVVEWREQ